MTTAVETKMELLGLFPTGVGRVNIGPLTEVELQVMQELGEAQVPNEGNTTSKARMILHDQRLTAVRERIKAELDTYIDNTICPANRPEIVITQSWLNYSTKGQWHHKHEHPGSWLSAVYYVAADPEHDKIYFHRQKAYERIPFFTENFNPFNSESWWIPVGTGDLVIFPSNLTHNVAPVQTDTTRISLSLNTWFNGTAGSADSLTELSCQVGPPFV
jgi:uncharacterized protein (TIGR02466 family)